AEALPAALPVMRWYLDHEYRPAMQQSIMKALAKVDAKEADLLRGELAGQPHANAVVVILALEQIIERKQSLDQAKLFSLCQHYRASIRNKARELNKLQKGENPGPFAPVKAMQSPAVRKLLDDIAGLMFD